MSSKPEPNNEWFDCEDPSRPTFSIAKNEVNDHYHSFGGLDRYWLQPAALLRQSGRSSSELLFAVESSEEKEIADEFARYFHQETGYDHPPYSSSEKRPRSEQVFLIKTPQRINASYDFMVGAVGTDQLKDGNTVVKWIWIHPFFRSSIHYPVALPAWKALEGRFGDLVVLAPISKQMRRFLEKNRPTTTYVEERY